jgi:hypothetical protein
MQSSSLLQRLGLVGAAGPHSGSKGEYYSPLVQSSECPDGRRISCKGSIALRSRSLLSLNQRPPIPIPSQKGIYVLVVLAARIST